MISGLRKYLNLKTLILLLPVLLFIVVRFIIGFNGLYGQDSHEYYRYSRAILDFFKTGNSPGDYFWPVYYPILGALFGLIINNLISLQLISIFSLSGSLFFLFKIMKEIFGDKKYFKTYLSITFLLSPYVFRNSLVVMSDLLTVFFITASFYFFINYLHNTELKQIILFSVFSAMAVLTRYATAVVLIIPAIVIINQIIKNRKVLHLLILLVIVLILSIPHILIRESGSAEFLRHSWLQDWSLSNFFNINFTTPEGIQHYRFPNIIYAFSSISFPTYMIFGLVLVVLSERNLPKNKFWLVSLVIVLLYAFFLAGIPFQNQRYLLLSYPFVVVSVFPGFERLRKILQRKKILKYAAISLMLILQIYYCIYYFRPAYERNILEKEIAEFVRNDTHKNVYAFDIDVSFMSYNVKKNVINMWKEKISDFSPNSIVIFNPEKFKEQWANMKPMLNWNELKLNYTLQVLKDFGDGWQAYGIRNK
jgi:hypothetical protein